MKKANSLESSTTSTSLLALSGFAATVLVPRIPELLRSGSRDGQRALFLQNVLLLIWRLKPLRKKLSLESIPETFIAGCAVVGLLGNIILKRAGATNAGQSLLRTVLILGALPSLDAAIEDGFESLTSGEADVPALLAMQVGLGLGYTNAALIILIMLTGGEAIEDYALNRAGNDLHSLLERSPGVANRRIGGEVEILDGSSHESEHTCEKVETEKITIGDVLLVKQDEIIPVDGSLLSFAIDNGQGLVDESLLTGEKVFVDKRLRSTVLGGTRNKGSPFWMKATALYSTSIVALMKSQLSSALQQKGSLELASKKFAASFTPITLAIAAIAWMIGYYKDSLRARDRWKRVLSVLMSATPCPAGIGVPIAMLSGMSIATKQYGATVKSGAALESLAKTSTVVLDKTGTLTKGDPSVVEFRVVSRNLTPLATITDSEILRLVASAEALSSHPLASAILQFHKAASNAPLYAVSKATQHNGAGLTTIINGHRVHIGLHQFFAEKGIARLQIDALDDQQNAQFISSFFKIELAGNGGDVEGMFYFDDEMRNSAYAFIQKLKQSGIRTIILSGDKSCHLQSISNKLGISEYYSCWPHEKAQHVLRLREEGEIVLMVGDGSNDSAALAAANVGLAVGASKIAAESADIVLMNEDLQNIGKLMETGKGVITIAQRTVKYGMSASLLQMIFAALGLTSPFVSACLQECVDLTAVLYALRALFIAVPK